MNRHPDPNTILDRHEKAVADILKRFMNMVVAATEPIDEGYTPEKASLNQMQMDVETAALVKAIENLLQITREIRRLWLTGPVESTPRAELENKERDAAIDAKTERICGLLNQWFTIREENQRAAARRLAEKRQQLEQEKLQQGNSGSDNNNVSTGVWAAETAGAAAGF
ncbi:hypothetical protein PG994_007291 [Apiospora phragmitis]|uniref:Mediator of RNA polymerase II transcription subunit 22 n=1 Tax=Apiospora phragmitis TaxID=2905665 RepID=A0ABR1V3Q3_9PEZI